MKINITTSIDPNCWDLAKNNDIAWNDALEFGIKFLVAEKDGIDYPDNKLLKRIANITARLHEKCQELEVYANPKDPDEILKEADKILGGITNGKPKE